MSRSSQRIRQYVGIAVVILAFVGGLIGWTWATLTVEPADTAPDSSATGAGPAHPTVVVRGAGGLAGR
jgi:uncharacterized alpha/beta hydrolase family protein